MWSGNLNEIALPPSRLTSFGPFLYQNSGRPWILFAFPRGSVDSSWKTQVDSSVSGNERWTAVTKKKSHSSWPYIIGRSPFPIPLVWQYSSGPMGQRCYVDRNCLRGFNCELHTDVKLIRVLVVFPESAARMSVPNVLHSGMTRGSSWSGRQPSFSETSVHVFSESIPL